MATAPRRSAIQKQADDVVKNNPRLLKRLNSGDLTALVELFEAAGAEVGDEVIVRVKRDGESNPIAVFGPEAVLVLELRADGSVTWRDDA